MSAPPLEAVAQQIRAVLRKVDTKPPGEGRPSLSAPHPPLILGAPMSDLQELVERALAVEVGMSKAELARAIGKEPSSIRRFFTAKVNPELKTVAAVADVLGARLPVRSVRAARR